MNWSNNTEPTCRGKLFGHTYAGGRCIKCHCKQPHLGRDEEQKAQSVGDVDTVLDSVAQRLLNKKKNNIHSEAHMCAKDVSEQMGERGKFAMYLGVIKRIGISNAYKIASEIKQSKKVDNPGKLFMFKAKRIM